MVQLDPTWLMVRKSSFVVVVMALIITDAECYQLVNGEWQQMNNGLTTSRYGHASSTTSSHQLWMTGGRTNDNGWQRLSSTNLIQQDGSITSGPELPQGRYAHCQMSYNGTVIITGKLFLLFG